MAAVTLVEAEAPVADGLISLGEVGVLVNNCA